MAGKLAPRFARAAGTLLMAAWCAGCSTLEFRGGTVHILPGPLFFIVPAQEAPRQEDPGAPKKQPASEPVFY